MGLATNQVETKVPMCPHFHMIFFAPPLPVHLDLCSSVPEASSQALLAFLVCLRRNRVIATAERGTLAACGGPLEELAIALDEWWNWLLTRGCIFGT